MPSTPERPVSPTSSAPFKYVGGHVAVDLVNTVDWTARGPAHDRLTSYDRLVEWAEEALIVSRATGAGLRAAARRNPRQREAALASALRLRQLLQRVFSAAAAGRTDDRALAELDALLERALAQRNVVTAGTTPRTSARTTRRFAWGWRDAGSLDTIVWDVIWDAATLLVSDDVERLRVCGGDDCGWMFVDRSRNGLRRWCEMEVCGMKEKNRRRRGRATRSPSLSRSRTT